MTYLYGTTSSTSSYTYSYSSNSNRISGLASGIDTETIVSNLMKAASAPLNSLKQKLQILQWQQEDYQSMKSTLQTLRDTVSTMKLQGTYLSKQATSSDDSVVTATATARAANTTYQIKVSSLATVATNSSTSAITQRSLTGDTALADSITITSDANQFQLTLGNGTAQTITLDAGTYTASQLVTAISSKINANSTLSGNVKVSLSSDNKLVFSVVADSAGAVKSLKIDSGTSNDALSLLGFSSSQQTVSFDPTATLLSQASSFSGVTWPSDNTFTFTINGHSFSVDASTASLDSVISQVNSANIGVTMFYDSSSGKVSLSTTSTGDNNPSGAEIAVTGDFMTSLLKIDEANEQGGTNAVFTLNGMEMERSSNSFTINGVTFNLKGTSTTTQTVTVSYDTSAAITAIKNFISAYNSAIATINDKINETLAKDDDGNYYKPLTDEQKSTMTSDQITAWQKKARQGDLRHDSLLTGILSNMRAILAGSVSCDTGSITVTNDNGDSVTTVLKNLSQLGITTSSDYTENGKLYLDEDKLNEALQSNPDAVLKLFTNSSDNDSEYGVMFKLYDALTNAISDLNTKAGSADATVDQSDIGTEITAMNKRITAMKNNLSELENRYWDQFTAMETAIAKINAQSSYLSSILSS